MPWYSADPLLPTLEALRVSKRNMVDFRFPVQNVIRPDKDFRGYAGKIVSGSIHKGERIVAFPSNKEANIKSIEVFEGSKKKATCPESVVITLDKEIDISRGDMLSRVENKPIATHKFKAIVCWMNENPCYPFHKDKFILKHTSNEVEAQVHRTLYKFDINSLSREDTNSLSLNDIGKLEIETTQNIFVDPYKTNKETGSFILIDPHTNETVAAGMIVSCDVEEGRRALSIGDCTVWLTGMPCSGKTTIAKALQIELRERNINAICLDGDDLRSKLNEDLGFSDADRKENLRRASHISQLFNDKGTIVVSSFVSPTNDLRDNIQGIITNMKMVYVKCSAEECARRDVKGMWARAKSGEIKGFTGYDAPFDEPNSPDLVVDTEKFSVEECVEMIIKEFFS
jgi:bifunctional enzyme CysN/CysC